MKKKSSQQAWNQNNHFRNNRSSSTKTDLLDAIFHSRQVIIFFFFFFERIIRSSWDGENKGKDAAGIHLGAKLPAVVIRIYQNIKELSRFLITYLPRWSKNHVASALIFYKQYFGLKRQNSSWGSGWWLTSACDYKTAGRLTGVRTE